MDEYGAPKAECFINRCKKMVWVQQQRLGV
jgi:hypothetical protein